MIKFKSVTYSNFLSSGNNPVKIDLGYNGTTLIYGKNGSGKSTLLAALSIALFNKTFRGVNKSQLINSITGKGMLVVVEFSVGSVDYIVKRGMKPDLFEIYQNGKLVQQPASVADYQIILEKSILKMNYKSFTQIVILGSGNYIPFMRLTAPQRREIIEDLLDIQVFSAMNSLLKERVSTNKERLVETQSKVQLIETKLDAVKDNNIKRIEDNLAEIDRLGREADVLLQVNANLLEADKLDEIALVELRGKIRALEAKKGSISEYKSAHDKTQFKISAIKMEIGFYRDSDNCPTCKQKIDDTFKRVAIEGKQEELTRLEELAQKALDKIAELEDEIAPIEVHNSSISKLRSAIMERMATTKANQLIATNNGAKIKQLKALNKTLGTSGDKQTKIGLKTAKDEYNKLVVERDLIQNAQALLRDGGIKAKIIKYYIPVINKFINKFLTQLSFMASFEFDEDFKETIKSRYRDEFTYESFSEGEKLRIDLAIMFAWRAIAKLRNSSSCSLLFLDEILDSSLDDSGIEDFIKIITEMSETDSVFVISHKPDQIIDSFDRSVLFEKRKNFTRVAA